MNGGWVKEGRFHLLTTFAHYVASAIGFCGQDEKWQSYSPGKQAIQLVDGGRGSPVFLAAAVLSLCLIKLGVGGREQS